MKNGMSGGVGCCDGIGGSLAAVTTTSSSAGPPYGYSVCRLSLRQIASAISNLGCESAWNKDPVFGVIGVQSGPPGWRVQRCRKIALNGHALLGAFNNLPPFSGARRLIDSDIGGEGLSAGDPDGVASAAAPNLSSRPAPTDGDYRQSRRRARRAKGAPMPAR
jgi:hypothetical protein